MVLPNVKSCIVAWLDNFIVATSSDASFQTLKKVFADVAADCNLQLHDWEEGDDITLLGIRLRRRFVNNVFVGQEFSHPPSWVKTTTDSIASFGTLREAAASMGKLMWSCYARNSPICLIPELLSVVKLIAAQVVAGARWDDTVLFETSSARQQLHVFAKGLNDVFTFPLDDNSPYLVVSSDAAVSDESESWAVTSGTYTDAGHWIDKEHIFFRELRAALFALVVIAKVFFAMGAVVVPV